MINLGMGVKNEFLRSEDFNAQANLINNILREMETLLDSRQLSTLNEALQSTLKMFSVSLNETPLIDVDYEEVNNKLVNSFIETKKLQGLSEKSLKTYTNAIKLLVNFCPKSLDTITTEDVREWFRYLMNVKGTSGVTCDNYRRYLNTFYEFCVLEGLIYKSPLKKIKKIKRKYQVKQPFTDEEIILLREAIPKYKPKTHLRESAVFELLLSSGMRIGELLKLNIDDLNFGEKTVIVTGKGNKQRKVYFNTLAKHAILKYLASRTDDNPALFVNMKKPHERIQHSGLSRTLREVGRACGVKDVHPHRFRRTFATNLLNKDVPIEQIRLFLGHTNIATTQLYVVENDEEIKYNHKRYVN